jgi:osmotically-inducible protein OsmY
VNRLIGVQGVTNNIRIESESHDAIEKKDVEKAIARSWSIDDCDIHVSGSTVALTGMVTSWYQKEKAGRLA